MPPAAATSTTGFFQKHPVILNQFEDDVPLRRAAAHFLPKDVYAQLSPQFASLGERVLAPEIFQAVVNAEHDLPYLSGSGFTAFGHPNAHALVTSPGWRKLQDFGIREGIVATGYEGALGPSARVAQLVKLHLWASSSAIVTCPSAMQDGAITVLAKELARDNPTGYSPDLLPIRKQVFTRGLARLLSRDPQEAWTSGQWMTERPGGSDVAGTETVATWAGLGSETDVDGLPLGPWEVNGFKWFSSATDCGCMVLLAQTDKGLSCFFAPSRKLVDGKEEMNGIRIQRLKNKLGTKALPTAEVEVKGMRAWLVGDEGRGVAVISSVLNITRYYNAVSSVGGTGRGLGIARAFARVRKFPSRQETLRDIPLFAKTLANASLRYRADLLLTTLVASLIGTTDAGEANVSIVPSSAEAASLLLRVLTPVAKAYTAKHSIHILQECMEALGGVGYMENVESPEMNVARLFRDGNVLSIWEGTTDVLSTDTVKVLTGRTGKDVGRALRTWITATLRTGGTLADVKAVTLEAMEELFQLIRNDPQELLSRGREVVWKIGDIVCSTLLVADAERDNDPVALECARRFVRVGTTFSPNPRHEDWQTTTKWDKRIAFDGDEPAAKL